MHLFSLFTIFIALVVAFGKNIDSVSMTVVNKAGAPIELFWVNIFEMDETNSHPLVKQTKKAIRNGTDTAISSYNTHEFVVRFKLHEEGKETRFVKGPKQETITVSYNAADGFSVKQMTKSDEMAETVKTAAMQCADKTGKRVDSAFAACIADTILEDINKVQDSKEALTSQLDAVSGRLRNYTCVDDTLETTEAKSTYEYYHGDKEYTINSLLDTPHAKIWTVDDFVTDEECQILMDAGRPALVKATVAAEDGSSEVSEHRKAQQAGYTFQHPESSDPLWPLYTRVFDLANTHAGYKLEPPGQEGFTIIQYNPGDQYTPHCDGDCDGSLHNKHGRVATAVLYCKTADRGGATTFTKSDIFVKPKNGSATFFSYKGPDGRMDAGMTEHSGCPVIEGEKWITTVWMREGMSEQDHWHLFDPSGIRILDNVLEEEGQYNGEEGESEDVDESGDSIGGVADDEL